MQDPITLTDAGVLQVFGANPNNYRRFGLAGHDGVDLPTVDGQQLYAPFAGVVVARHNDPSGWGLNLELEESDTGYHWWLCHLSDFGASQPGDLFVPTTPLCLAGSTGNTDTPHVHVTLQPDVSYSGGLFRGRVDPLPFLRRLSS